MEGAEAQVVSDGVAAVALDDRVRRGRGVPARQRETCAQSRTAAARRTRGRLRSSGHAGCGCGAALMEPNSPPAAPVRSPRSAGKRIRTRCPAWPGELCSIPNSRFACSASVCGGGSDGGGEPAPALGGWWPAAHLRVPRPASRPPEREVATCAARGFRGSSRFFAADPSAASARTLKPEWPAERVGKPFHRAVGRAAADREAASDRGRRRAGAGACQRSRVRGSARERRARAASRRHRVRRCPRARRRARRPPAGDAPSRVTISGTGSSAAACCDAWRSSPAMRAHPGHAARCDRASSVLRGPATPVT